MLSHIQLKNFAIIEELDLELNGGMTALTGETGAGKSILVDAIGLVLGDRADSSVVKHGADKTEITLTVDIDDTPGAKQWLTTQEMISDDDADEVCILRRVINSQGKSRAWINGTPCNLSMLRQLGEQLVDIHGQHEHQSLMKKEMQRDLLDNFARHHLTKAKSETTDKLLENTSIAFEEWRKWRDRYTQLTSQHSDHQAKLDLLRFQTRELDDFNLTKNEATELDEEFTRLSHAGQLIDTSSQGILLLYDADEQSAYALLSDVSQSLEKAAHIDQRLTEPLELLQQAQIQIQEASDALRRYQDLLELDPQRLEWVNERLSTLHDLARKHQTSPEQLYDTWQSLLAQLDELDSDAYDLDALQKKLVVAEKEYRETAEQLSQRRQEAAKRLSKQVTSAMQQLGMEGGRFTIEISPGTKFSPTGLDTVEFQVSANPGQPPKPLAKVASGGELSRISLAIQMITAQRVALPALIFDEVDSGIGGAIAEVVGKELRNLGNKRQVLCVTHLPQVASQAHHHFKVTKIKRYHTTQTGLIALTEDQRVEEIARMIGGSEMTETTLNLAREMLARP